MELEKTRAAIFRSKARWAADGKKCSRYFLSLEKSNYNKKVMTSIMCNNGQISNEPVDIMNEQYLFYSDLYTANEYVEFKLVNLTEDKLAEDEKFECDNDIDLSELTEALSKLKLSKPPGCDGLTVEFYQRFWSQLGPMLLNAFECSRQRGFLPDSSKRGVISLIPKTEKNLLYVKNWRPLTMLNVDYKILATLLARQIKPKLNDLISEDQCGFVQGRQASDVIRRTMDMFGENLDVPGYVICVDYMKCFDLIEYSGIRGSLKYFNFGPNFIGWVNLLLNGFESCVTNNGYFSDWISVTRSCHQGCPLAPTLMLLCAETMAHAFKQSRAIRPYTICELVISQEISQFADDTQVFSNDNPTSLNTINETFKVMHNNIGFTVNQDKTTIHKIGGAKCIDTVPFVWGDNRPTFC